METTRQQKQRRAQRQHDMADDLVRRAEKKIARDGILQPPEIAIVFAVACAMAICKWYSAHPEIGNDLAGMALRTIMKNLGMRGIAIPDLSPLEDWAPPNVHWGTDTEQ
jgi:hypothetical protein